MTAHRVLLLEDDANLGRILQEHLQMNGYEVTLCADGQEGTERFRPGAFDLCLVDVMMPRKDGFSFAAEIRRVDSDIPLIFLTAKSMREDRIEGFKLGCDDYITKPFSIEELMLRIHAVLKRCRPAPDNDTEPVIALGKYRFDSLRQTLEQGGEVTNLTPRESDLLRLLCKHRNRTLSREVALTEIWGDDSYFAGRSMDVFISRLRKLLKDDPGIEIISIHGKGFRLVVGGGPSLDRD
jgi:DNA-binding response OmpR family regulator